MGLYNFKERFVPLILSGAKTHTIRAPRKHSDKPGNICHLYTGLRVKGKARLLMRAPCVRVESIFITAAGEVWIGNQLLDEPERERFARCDGFESFADMAEFWKGRLPFVGLITYWDFQKRFMDTPAIPEQG